MKQSYEVLQSISEAHGTGVWLRGKCYSCDERRGSPDPVVSFACSPSYGRYMCFRCGLRGRMEAGDEIAIAPKVEAPKESTPIPEEFDLLYEGELATARFAETYREYLRSRAVSDATGKSAGLGVCLSGKYEGRIIVPIRDVSGAVCGWQARAMYPSTYVPKWYTSKGFARQSHLFNEAAVSSESDEPLLLVEAVFDALPYYPNAVACLGKPSRGQLMLLAKTKRPVVVCLDGDAVKEAGWVTRRLALGRVGKSTACVSLPAGQDPSSMAVERGVDHLLGLAKAALEENKSKR